MKSSDQIDHAITALTRGEIIGVPTETVYGLGVKADDLNAINRLLTAKGRSPDNPLSICLPDPSLACHICHVGPQAKRLIEHFWPGPLTLVLPAKSTQLVHANAYAHRLNIGLRCPDIWWREKMIEQGFSTPIALSSANLSGAPTPTYKNQVSTVIADKISVLMGENPSLVTNPATKPAPQKNKLAIASTIVALSDDTPQGAKAVLLRRGPLLPEDFGPFALDWQSPKQYE